MNIDFFERAYDYGRCARAAGYGWGRTLDGWNFISAVAHERSPDAEELASLRSGYEAEPLGAALEKGRGRGPQASTAGRTGRGDRA